MTCSDLNGYMDLCDEQNDCAYNPTADECDDIPTYSDCTEFNDYPIACDSDSNCSFDFANN